MTSELASSSTTKGPPHHVLVCAAGEGISAEDNGPNAMFKLSALKGPQAAVKVGEAAVPDEEDAAAEPESSQDEEDAGPSDIDSDEAARYGTPFLCMLGYSLRRMAEQLSCAISLHRLNHVDVSGVVNWCPSP